MALRTGKGSSVLDSSLGSRRHVGWALRVLALVAMLATLSACKHDSPDKHDSPESTEQKVGKIAAALTGSSSITSNFNGTAIAAGNTLWFTAVMKVNGAPANQVAHLYFNGANITFTAASVNYNVPVPPAQISIPCTKRRHRRGPSGDASSRAWRRVQSDDVCCSDGGTVTWPRGSSSSRSGMRARVRVQYFGASSRYLSRGQYGMTRMTSVR